MIISWRLGENTRHLLSRRPEEKLLSKFPVTAETFITPEIECGNLAGVSTVNTWTSFLRAPRSAYGGEDRVRDGAEDGV